MPLRRRSWKSMLLLFAPSALVPHPAFALSCPQQLRYAPLPQSDVREVLSLVWGTSGLAVVLLLWVSALLLWSRSGREVNSRKISYGMAIAAVVLAAARLTIGAVYFCEGFRASAVLAAVQDKTLAVISGSIFIGIPLLVLGILLASGLRLALERAAGIRPAAGMPSRISFETAVLAVASALMLFAWFPLASAWCCFFAGTALPFAFPQSMTTEGSRPRLEVLRDGLKLAPAAALIACSSAGMTGLL